MLPINHPDHAKPMTTSVLPINIASAMDKRDWIAGLEKGLAVIDAFDDAHPRMTASEAGKRCAITRTAARRYLLTLQHLGYVASDGKLFWLTPRVLRLGHSYLESARLPRIVQPFLQRVTAGTQESAYVSVLDGDDIVYIARNGAARAMNIGYVLGARVQAQVTAAGLLMLSLRPPEWIDNWLATHELVSYTAFTVTSKEAMRLQMKQVQAQGWATSEQQLDLNFRGVAIPLRDRYGVMVAALSVTMPMGFETSEESAKRVLPVMNETAQAMRNLI
jgi:IclR family transcriptional regulator, pca regulon regulatory protein